jgi:hypothetical protein
LEHHIFGVLYDPLLAALILDQIFHPLTWCHLLAFSEISRKSICIEGIVPLFCLSQATKNSL